MRDLNVLSFAALPFESKNAELAALVTKAQTGEMVAFDGLYNLFFHKIYRFVYFRVGHKQTAEDLTEDTFVKAFASLSSLSSPELFEGWLYKIARNLIIDYYRQKKLTINLLDVENSLEYETNVVDLLNLQYQQAILLKLLKELGADEQAVIRMRFLEDLDTAEIAAILGKSTGNIRVLQHRALHKLIELRKKIEEEDE